ncbi:MAG: 30S ribosomal protein S1 [Microgenomates group bacterium GW2011_GWF2_47_9]|nr:MAG: 30S ribosomal protein S1 [Microgenomates group bacterium GW2011_GWF2_47_9]
MAKTKTTTTKKETSPKAEPKTMKDLLESSGYELSIPKKGETITGLVTGITRKAVLVDIGAKTEGLVAEKEYAIAKDFVDSLKVGDEIEVYVMSEENEKGQIMLSLRRAMFDKLWGMLEGYLENDKEVQVKGVEVNRGGMIVKWQGLRGFVPSSQFGAQLAGNFQDLMNKNFAVKAIEVDREKNRLIFSEKHVSEAAIMEKREKALKVVAKGEVFKGKVTGVLSFGAFVAVEVPVEKTKITVEGLVHISEISWEKVEDIHRYLKVGDAVEVKVLGVEEGTGKLNLSIKQLAMDPWSEVGKKYAAGTTVKGMVSRSAPFGVFVNFEPGVDGLIHVSKTSAFGELTPGEKIEVLVESVDPEHRRMSLGPVLTEVPVGYK